MKKKLLVWLFASLILVLAACGGEKSKEDVVTSLENKLEEMTGYKAEAVMSLKTGQEAQKYNIEIWHKKKNYYRVLLSNEQDEKGSQIILRNEDGVYVLTPALNKSFKFQSEWPHNSSQPYLYGSLVQDVLKDTDSEFSSTDNYYVFRTKTNYQNSKNLPYQEVYFNKKSLTPAMVKVLDKDLNSLVEVQFNSFELNPTFADDAFDTEKNMTSGTMGIPVMASTPEMPFTVLYPLNKAGAELTSKKEVDIENGKRVILTFEGSKNFTIVEEKVTAYPASVTVPQEIKGEPVNLGFTMGALTDNSLEWNYQGMSFYLASNDLTKDEMVDIAISVQGQAVK